jgi:hypothetical protein
MSDHQSPLVLPLIRSLKKAEKRYFKVQHQNGREADKKFIWLFDYLEQYDKYDPQDIVKKYPDIKPAQLPNLKTHLYKRLLQSLSQFSQSGNSLITLRETVNHIQILFEKGLLDHCWKLIKRAKKMAYQIENLEMLLLVLRWERTLLLSVSGTDKISGVDQVVQEVEALTQVINHVNKLSNVAIQLHAFVVRSVYVRSDQERKVVQALVEPQGETSVNRDVQTFNEQLHLYSVKSEYHHFLMEFEESYTYAQKWIDLFSAFPHMKDQEIESYVSGLNMIMKNQVRLGLLDPLVHMIEQTSQIQTQEVGDAMHLILLKYNFTYQFHKFFLEGRFSEGVRWFRSETETFRWLEKRLDLRSKMVLYYQLGSLYFGIADYRSALNWLNKIINMPGHDVREDIICFTRILILICHYELNNLDLIDYFIRSTYRLFLQKTDLYTYQTSVIHFLKKLNIEMTDEALEEAFSNLYKDLKSLADKSYEKRAFFYFDIISWLESKISNVPVAQVIRNKFELTR